MNVFRAWFSRYLADPQVVSLVLILLAGLVLVLFVGQLITPVLAALVVAYLFDSPVTALERLHVPRSLGAALVSIVLIVIVVWISFALIPLLTRQAGQLVQELPRLIHRTQDWIGGLPDRYPALITNDQINALIGSMSIDIGALRQALLSRSLMVGASLLYLAVYLVLVPLMVFFMLRDKHLLMRWCGGFVPENGALLHRVWNEVNVQLGNYIRGKALEIIIVWIAAYATFWALGLNYAMLLSALVGFSVLVPYVGAFGMTIPVVLVAYTQWGMETETLTVLVAYTVLQMLDGNVLVPILFSEAVDLHPVAIITAVLFFGGIWGFWGIFFAIPLATLVHAVIKAWPRRHRLAAGGERVATPNDENAAA
ncbi:AI-2E family transporter [Salinisphaera sp. Q1T1-3]|uniref:AI-2E family transporter n=1 Tax=Salinisphaera sp. Q1T1-3 TaxID=2321229 RepID=UPI000E721A53|nr:AI-2E family transporter [Salinisphaera sp. Q1T1-3]RJS92677.1 AI-2E family transporter [Salinisphaera sp. Q1T1-3]